MLATGEFNVEQGGNVVAIAQTLLPLLTGYSVAYNVTPLLRYIKNMGINYEVNTYCVRIACNAYCTTSNR
jgi:hypothetical protein